MFISFGFKNELQYKIWCAVEKQNCDRSSNQMKLVESKWTYFEEILDKSIIGKPIMLPQSCSSWLIISSNFQN